MGEMIGAFIAGILIGLLRFKVAAVLPALIVFDVAAFVIFGRHHGSIFTWAIISAAAIQVGYLVGWGLLGVYEQFRGPVPASKGQQLR